MRLRNVLQQITEAISFGRKEINQVIRSDDIRIGFEFEVVFERDTGEPVNIWDLSLEELRQMVPSIVDRIETDVNSRRIGDPRRDYEDNVRHFVLDYIYNNNLVDYYSNPTVEDAVTKAEELVRQYGLEDVVREVIHDSSIENDDGEGLDIGVEIITNPLPPSDIQDVMETMFSLINDNDGQTNRSTGLHMNISSTDFSFNLNNFDLLKFFLFIDEGFIESSFERESSDYVMSLKDKVSGNEVNVLKALDRYLDYGIEGLEDFTREAITIREKYAGINILNMDLDSTNMGQNRIEVRYPGNDYASKSPSEVTWHAYRILYMLMIAFNEDFERETYLRLLYEFWDDITKDTFGKSFGEALREFRETEDVTSERTTERSAMDQVERIRQFQRLGTDDENNISVKAVLKNLENRYRAGDLKSSELLAVKDILRQYNRL